MAEKPETGGSALPTFKLAGSFIAVFGRQFIRNGCRESAAALTYTSLFAIVPMMTVVFTVLSVMPQLKDSVNEIRNWAFESFAPGVGNQVIGYLEEFSRQASNLTAVGILFLVVTSILMLRTIEKNLNRIWQVYRPRKGTTSLMMYSTVLTLGPMLLGAGLAVSSYVTSLTLFSDAVNLLGGVRFWLSMLPLVFTTAMLALLYIVVPNCHVPVRAGFAGAFIAAVMFELAKAGFATFIKLSPSYQVVYGAFAAVPIFLLWIYISWIIVLAGAELARTFVTFDDYRRPLPYMQSLLRLLELFWQRQQQGCGIKPKEVQRVLKTVEANRWETFRNLLFKLNLIRRTEDGEFVLCRDLNALTLYELAQMLPWSLRRQLDLGECSGRVWEPEVEKRSDFIKQALNVHLQISLAELFSMETDTALLPLDDEDKVSEETDAELENEQLDPMDETQIDDAERTH